MSAPKPFDESTTSHRTIDGVRPSRKLIVLWDGGMVQHELPERGRLVLGRGQDCDVRIDHSSVSRRHVAIIVGDDGYAIEDLGSSNGTRVDDRKLGAGETMRFEPQCQIRLGATTVILPQRNAEALGPNVVAELSPVPHGPAMAALYEQIELVARGKIAVLILGETGAGKELVARALHSRSPRASRPFVSLNCAALGDALLESELFGFEQRALPGATEAKAGLVEATDGGTLFLDEIGGLSSSTQGKLLRVLESGEATRIGSVRPHRVDVRFVAATNKDLEDLVTSGALRSDLYFRLAGAKLYVPPLRDRQTEIPPLAQQFAAAACAEIGRPAAEVTQAAVAALLRHDWPGNVRELKNVIERAVLLSRGGPIRPEHLALDARSGHAAATMRPEPSGGAHSDLRAQLSVVERDRILAALAECQGNQSRAAKMLGISRRTLIGRIEAYQLPRPRKRPDEP